MFKEFLSKLFPADLLAYIPGQKLIVGAIVTGISSLIGVDVSGVTTILGVEVSTGALILAVAAYLWPSDVL